MLPLGSVSIYSGSVHLREQRLFIILCCLRREREIAEREQGYQGLEVPIIEGVPVEGVPQMGAAADALGAAVTGSFITPQPLKSDDDAWYGHIISDTDVQTKDVAYQGWEGDDLTASDHLDVRKQKRSSTT